MMRLFGTALAIVLAASGAAHAQGTQTLRAALEQIPQSVLASPVPDLAYFIDIQTALNALDLDSGDDPNALRQLIGTGRPLEALGFGGRAAWEERAGVGLEDLDYFAFFSRLPNDIAVWGLGENERVEALLADLAARDFVPMGNGEILANGEPRVPNLQSRDVLDPWRGSVGQASFVLSRENALVQAFAPELLLGLGGPGAAQHPVIGTALAGLDAAMGQDAIMQAMVVSPMIGLAGPDLAGLLGQSMDEIRSELEAAVQTDSADLPFYLGGIIADLAGDTPRLAIALTFGDCKTASLGMERLVNRWSDDMRTVALAMESAAVTGEDGLCAGVVLIEVEETPTVRNPAYFEIFQSLVRGGVPVLAIGTGA